MSKCLFMKKVANYIIHQIRGKGPVRVYAPKDWLEAEDIGQYDTIKVTFEVVERYKSHEHYEEED